MVLKTLLRGTALAAALLLSAPVLAQTTPGASGAGRPEGASQQGGGQQQQLIAAEQMLRVSVGQLGAQGAEAGQARQNALTALGQMRQNLDTVPQARRNAEAWRNLDTQITEAQRSLSGGQPDMNRARQEIEQVLSTVPAFRNEFQSSTAPGQPRNAEEASSRIREDNVQMNQQQGSADQQTGASSAPARTVQAAGGAGRPLGDVQRLVGTNLTGVDGNSAGRVENLLVDPAGHARGAVVEWGGFLGIGERRAVVPMEHIQLGEGSDRARLNLSREQLEQMGQFNENNLAQYGSRFGWGEGLRLAR